MLIQQISDKISYIPATENPLSADIGIIRDGGQTWLFDVGNGTAAIDGLSGSFQVVLSHFHQDHTGNLQRLDIQNLYVSGETRRHIGSGILVKEDLFLGGMHLFPIPSSHCKGCLGPLWGTRCIAKQKAVNISIVPSCFKMKLQYSKS